MKKILATLLASAMTLSALGGLVACNGDTADANANVITVWAPENSLGSDTDGTGYKGMLAGWREAHPEFDNFEVKFVAKGEGDAKGAIGNNAKGAAEVFFFASDHYKDLATGNALQPLTDEYVTNVHGRDAKGTYEFVTGSDDKLYAFPATNDNGFFLWYNDQYLSAEDVKSLDTILEKCKEEQKHFHLEYDNSWYSATFMFGLGCKFNYDDEGHYHGDTDTPGAKAAAKAMYAYVNSANNKNAIDYVDEDGNATKLDVMVKADSFSAGLADGSIAAAVSYVSSFADIEKAVRAQLQEEKGAVDEDELEEILSHIQATTLPKFKATIEGQTEQEYYMGTFYGGKYCGVNRQKSEAKIKASLSLADWLTNEHGQEVRFDIDGSGPSNLNVAAMEKVQESKGLKAYNAQVALGTEYNCVQGAQTGAFWGDTGIKAFVKGIFLREQGTDFDYTTEAGVLAQLSKLAAAIAE